MAHRALTLRLARPEDSPAMAQMAREQIEAGLTPRYTASRIGRLIRDADTLALVADDGQALQGFAIMSFGEERAHLVLLCVQPGQRRHGTGRGLLDWLVRSARVAGIASIHLELRADNAGALEFYRALGFEQSLLVPGYYEGRIAARRMLLLLRRPA
jgi:ribosomal-protein-alanine N-acetyltransferase